MPTLIRAVSLVEPDPESEGAVGETARASDLAFLSQVDLADYPRNNNADNTHIDMHDDSTLSGSYLVGALREAFQKTANDSLNISRRTTQREITDRTNTSASLEASLDEGNITLDLLAGDDSTMLDTDEESILQKDPGNFSETKEMYGSDYATRPPPIYDDIIEKPPRDRTMGPNEKLYKSQYSSIVAFEIEKYKQRTGICDYKALNEVGKEKERDRVQSLLARLKISAKENFDDQDINSNTHNSSPALSGTGLEKSAHEGKHSLLDSSVHDATHLPEINDFEKSHHSPNEKTPTKSPTTNLQSPGTQHVDSFTTLDNNSMILLTPNPPTLANKQKSSAKSTLQESSDSSIEMARSCRVFESPQTIDGRRKRLPTMSGKRGADTSRVRTSDSPFLAQKVSHQEQTEKDTFQAHTDYNGGDDMDMDMQLVDHDDINVHAFASTQSPISLCDTPPHSSRRPFLQSNTTSDAYVSNGYGNEFEGQQSDSLDDSLTQDRRVHWDLPARRKDGTSTTLFYKPLDVEARTREIKFRSTQTFPDPLSSFPDKLQRRLGRVFDWIQRAECNPDAGSTALGLLLSLSELQIIAVLTKFFLNDSEGSYSSEIQPTGGTLIVCRSKEDLVSWERALRECTPYSVLNHSAMPLKSRKTPSSVQECQGYDMVLTTYDALKSQDTTVVLDADGIASCQQSTSVDTWISSRSGSQATEKAQCRRLSILHCVSWKRVLFMDIPGRKCFLTKPDTARAEACRILKGRSRFAFLLSSPSDETEDLPLKLLLSDRKAVPSISSVLHYPDASSLIANCTLVFGKQKKQPHTKSREKS